MTSLLARLAIINLTGLLPGSYCLSSQLCCSLLFRGSLFLVSLSLVKYPFLHHCTPASCPLYLGNYLFFIECVSISIRPFTLILRLCANMTAGHVIILILRRAFLTYPLLLPAGVALLLFEIFICLIQALVFCLLLDSYIK